MSLNREEEILHFNFQNFFLGISFLIVCMLVLGLSANDLKIYAYSIIFIYVSVVLCIFIFRHQKVQQALRWDKLKGTVIESKKIIKRCIGGRPSFMYTINIKYRYAIDKKKIYNDSWSLFKCEDALYSSEEIDQILKTMKSKNEVDIFVNPKNRYEAYINQDELLKSEPLSVVVSLILLIVALPLFFLTYFA